MQWGYISKGSSSGTVTLPIAISQTIYAMYTGIRDDSHNYQNTAYNNFTKTTFQYWYANDGIGMWWLAVCRQQWGKKAQSASNTVSFPISFSTIYSLTTCVWANQAIGGDYGTAGSVSTKSFVTFCGEPLGWIATGK